MQAYIEMMRLGNCAMSAVAVAIGALLASGGSLEVLLSSANALVAAIVVILITAAGNIINDYVDVEADRVNRPKRPIPSGRAGEKASLYISLVMFVAGITLSFFINWYSLILASVNSALLIAYSFTLQNRVLIKNVTVGYLVGSTFLFGGAALGSLMLPFLLMLLAGFSTVSREVVKDLEDIEGDRKGFMRRLAIKSRKMLGSRFGIKGEEAELRLSRGRAKWLAITSMLLALAISPAPFVMGLLGLAYLAFLAPTIIVFYLSLRAIMKSERKSEFASASRTIKLGMNLGLLAFIAGAIF